MHNFNDTDDNGKNLPITNRTNSGASDGFHCFGSSGIDTGLSCQLTTQKQVKLSSLARKFFIHKNVSPGHDLDHSVIAYRIPHKLFELHLLYFRRTSRNERFFRWFSFWLFFVTFIRHLCLLVRFQSYLFKVQKVLYVRSVGRDRAEDNMDGRSLTVFAAAAAIGASFYVFLTPDGKKKKGVKRGKCKIVWYSCVAPLSDATYYSCSWKHLSSSSLQSHLCMRFCTLFENEGHCILLFIQNVSPFLTDFYPPANSS